MYTPSVKSADQPQADSQHAPSPDKSKISEETTTTGQDLDRDLVKAEQNSEKTSRCKPARLTIDTQNVSPIHPVAEDTKSKAHYRPSLRHRGLSSDSSDEEEPTVNQKPSTKVGIRKRYSDSCF